MNWWWRKEREQDLERELRSHVEAEAEEQRGRGVDDEEARYVARRALGNTTLVSEDVREAWGWMWLERLAQDVRYGLRTLHKNPSFSIVAVLSLAIGIGANTTIFTFVSALLLRPLPYPGSDRLVVLQEQQLKSAKLLNVHPVNFIAWRERAHSLQALVLVQAPPMNVMGRDGAEQVIRLMTTSELFNVFRVTPILGRAFSVEDTWPGGQGVVILGYRFWQRWFGGDPTVVGQQLRTIDASLTIIGVAPQGFRVGLTEPDVFTPLVIDPANPAAAGSRAFECYGRLTNSVNLDAARGELEVIASTLQKEHRFDEDIGVSVSALHEYLTRETRPGLHLLMAVVATVLTLACVNLAGLLMARGIGRRHELAVRAALGATADRLIRQLMTESCVVAFCGGVAGLVISYWATKGLAVLGRGALTLGVGERITVDTAALLFTFAVSMVTALGFGLLPARQAIRLDPQEALRERARGATSDRWQERLRGALVVGQIALAVVLLVGAGLLLRTLTNLVRVNLGFNPNQTMTMSLFLGVRPAETRARVVDQILDRVEQIPGVKAAGTVQFLPLSGMSCGTGFWLEEQAANRDMSRLLPAECALVSRGYFAAMGIPILSGRPFDHQDRMGSPRVVMVNDSFAQRYFPDGRVVGRHILVPSSNQALAEIVGIVGDVRHNGLTSDPAPTVFLLHGQTPGYITSLVVRTSGDETAKAEAIRHAIHEVDPTQAASAARSLEEDVRKVLLKPRLYAVLVTSFAVIAIGLAAMGLYGLLAYIVAQRTHEIGIRLALGATRQKVFLELLAYGAVLLCGGLFTGIVAAFAVRQLASSLVFGVTTGDPLTYLMAVLTLGSVAFAAITIPASRASSVDPISALRYE